MAAIVGLSPLTNAAAFQHHSIFGPGSKGPEVRLLQSRLRHLGYASVKATGYFGPVTKRAVQAFQRTHHLRGDGVVNPRTERALRTARTRGTASSASPAFEAAPPRTYRVKPGDTLSGIARRFHVSWMMLARLNHLHQPTALRAGQVILLAPSHRTKHITPWRYRVKRGDTLASIARRFHTTWTKLAVLNHLRHPDQLRAGSLIAIRTASPRWAHAAWTLSRRVIATALRYRGVPYVWGGESPHGFDCSGLVQYVLAENGVHIGRTTWEQYRAVRHVPRSRLTPGDLVFFHTYASGASHVGIYIGADPRQGLRQAFIDAPTQGQRVKIQNLDNPFWISHYYGAGVVRR